MNHSHRYRHWAVLIVICLSTSAARAEGVIRHYYIAAEEIDWDFAPLGREEMMGGAFSDAQNTFVASADSRIGSVYHMAHYVAYQDAAFTIPVTDVDPSNGILGPIIRAEVGDEIEIVFRNDTSVPTSMHPHGVFYDKASEGAMTNDGAGLVNMGDDAVPPGGTYTYHWGVPER
ncbi:MAG: multicopper oxidase domain-containing protein, partial [Alphaproteobacteria bacterium]|nr:multicopper oxidase domain-containing protein [Alphaproteobacteria bacterium]